MHQNSKHFRDTLQFHMMLIVNVVYFQNRNEIQTSKTFCMCSEKTELLFTMENIETKEALLVCGRTGNRKTFAYLVLHLEM